ncbi:MAG TPA: hypothetical protein VJH37_00340 [Candidatus Nanoarchaeia archaeon]|nr:hypothetical protein [Candidatus Nanoarchaeia archaeon]
MEKKDALKEKIVEIVYEDPKWVQKLVQLWEQSKQKKSEQYAAS